jgi:hypothetical protein
VLFLLGVVGRKVKYINLEVKEWIHLAQNIDQWRTLMNLMLNKIQGMF